MKAHVNFIVGNVTFKKTIRYYGCEKDWSPSTCAYKCNKDSETGE